MTISKPPSLGSVLIGNNASYTITVENVGQQPAINVTVTEVLPPGLEFVSGPGCTADGQVVTCGGPNTSIPVGGNLTFTLVVQPTVPGTLTSNASVTATGEQNTANNGPALGTLNVTRTCGQYNGDGSAFDCGDAFTLNTNNTQNSSPSSATCCVSAMLQHISSWGG